MAGGIFDEDFDRFLASLAYDYLFVASEHIEASGIDFHEAPSVYLGVQVLQEYFKKTKELGPKAAIFELKELISLLERYDIDCQKIPQDPKTLSELYHNHLKRHRALEVACKIQAKPTQASQIIFEYQRQQYQISEEKTLFDSIHDWAPKFYQAAKHKKAIVYLPDYTHLSNAIGGFNPGRLGMLLGTTGYGKTTLALNMALSAAKKDPVYYINMEMSRDDINRRLASIYTGMSQNTLNQGLFCQQELYDKLPEHSKNITITNGQPMSVSEIKAKVKLFKSKDIDIKFLVIDYDQKLELPRTSKKEQWELVNEALKDLEQFAIMEKIYILVLAQVNRTGQISSSFRSTYGTHHVMEFKEHHELGPIVEFSKNRHGDIREVVTFDFDKTTLTITEKQRTKLSKQKPKPSRYQGGMF